MIVTRLIGGLGNQMFQYAAGRALAFRLDAELRLDISGFDAYRLHEFSLERLAIQAPVASPNELAAMKRWGVFGRRWRSVVREEHLTRFNPRLLQSPDGTYLDGYWQSERYFESVAPSIREEFRARFPLSEASAGALASIRAAECSVSVHVRRGDYVTNPDAARVHGALDVDYYRRAMRELRGELGSPRFFVFSDEKQWAAAAFDSDPDVEIVAVNDSSRNQEDLELMTACRHHVIANSSFSWWGAWLNPLPGKIVIAPQRWFVDPTVDSSDVVPPDWRRR